MCIRDSYDPGYLQSMRRNFTQFPLAQTLSPTDRTAQAMAVLAERMIKEIT